MDATIELVYLNPQTLEEEPNGVPYTRKRIGNAVILSAGHQEIDAQQIKAEKE